MKFNLIVPDTAISTFSPIPVVCCKPEVNCVMPSGESLESPEQRQDIPLSRQINYCTVGSIYETAIKLKHSCYKASYDMLELYAIIYM